MTSNLAVNWWLPGQAVSVSRPLDDDSQERAGSFAFWSLAAFTFVLMIAPQDFVRPLAALRPALVAGALAGIGYLVQRSSGVPRSDEVSIQILLAIVLLAWAVFTIPMSYWPGGSVSTLLDLFIKALAAFWLLAKVVSSRARLRLLMWMLSIFSVPIALTSIRHYSSGAFLPEAGQRAIGYGQGLASNPNDLALTLDILIPLTLALVFTARSRRARTLALMILLIQTGGVVSTFSRGGFIGLAVVGALTIGWLIERRAVGIFATMGLVALLAMPLLPSAYLERLATISDYQSDPTGSAQERWRDMRMAAAFVAQHPLVGAGLGQDYLALNEMRGPTWKSVHNAYLKYAVELGLPGLALFVALVAGTIGMAWRVERKARRRWSPRGGHDWELGAFAHGIRIALLAFAAAAFFYPVAYHFYFFYLAGLTAALRTIWREPPSATATARSTLGGGA
jgi:O-antigen ligase